ncbi:class IV adenylate cyclase [Vibrio salinus]|uniref:class IV adenylate cyclase n=1 Tax=Vibrio salinus TaxID=2899784 RepID=UPI001E544DDF|nr:class IV adenylate cyclase [Vibrio salinus]MCE0495066.1 class IV adenylate cyclase [Vibrio salinus]
MSSDHFKGKYEVELKFRLPSRSGFLQKLSVIQHEVMVRDNVETDWYFDTKDQLLLSQNKSVSIREMEPSGIKLWIVKGPESDRCEATDITKSDTAKSMLKTMGYEVFLKVKKIRSIFFIGKFHVTLDQLDGIGDFAEFAIMTDDESALSGYKAELEQLSEQFGLSTSDIESKSYRCLCMEHCA